MNYVNWKNAVWVIVVFAVIIWAIILKFSPAAPIAGGGLWESYGALSSAINVTLVAIVLFATWGWHFKIFRSWLVRVPDIRGTWKGSLQSSWINPETGKELAPIPIQLVIRQTLLWTSCRLYTGESSSWSFTASFIFDQDGTTQLIFNYLNEPEVRYHHRSNQHYGTCMLRVLLNNSKSLNGTYWTARSTKGDMQLVFDSKNYFEK